MYHSSLDWYNFLNYQKIISLYAAAAVSGLYFCWCISMYNCWVLDDYHLWWCHSWLQGSWGQHEAHLGPTGPRWAPCWPHEICYIGWYVSTFGLWALCEFNWDLYPALVTAELYAISNYFGIHCHLTVQYNRMVGFPQNSHDRHTIAQVQVRYGLFVF